MIIVFENDQAKIIVHYEILLIRTFFKTLNPTFCLYAFFQYMTETNLKEILISKNQGVLISSSVKKQLNKIQGVLTSSIQLRGENAPAPYYYSFIRLKGQS